MSMFLVVLVVFTSGNISPVWSKLGSKCVTSASSLEGFSCGLSLEGLKPGDVLSEKCIPRHYVCDGFSDCPDNQDEGEFACAASCPPAWLKCEYGGCQPPSHLCDGSAHCPGREDETDLACGWREMLEGVCAINTYDIRGINDATCLANII